MLHPAAAVSMADQFSLSQEKIHFKKIQYFGSGALSGKMLLVRIVENNKIDAYLGQFRLSKC